MVSRPEARKRDRCSRGRDEVSKERKRENGYCGLSILFLRILLLRFVHVLFLSLALSSSDSYARFLFISVTFRSPCSVLDWFENSASFSHRVLFFFSPFLSFFLFHRSEQGDASNEVRRIEMCTPSAFRLLHSTRGRFVPGIESRTRMKD